jgi:predicted metal-dependent hydrolase
MLILACIQTPALRDQLSREVGFSIRWLPDDFPNPRTAVNLIADARPALLVVEIELPLTWLALVRSDPATRRLPVVALASTPEGEQRAMSYRVDAVLHLPELQAELGHVLVDHARPAVDQERLSSECDSMIPSLVLKGLREFNAGEYFEAHELLETAWKQETGPVRDVYRAILQIGVGYLQITRGNYQGAHKMFIRAVQWIAPLPDRCHGIDIAQLRADAAVVRTTLETLGPERIKEFDLTLLKPIIFEEPS